MENTSLLSIAQSKKKGQQIGADDGHMQFAYDRHRQAFLGVVLFVRQRVRFGSVNRAVAMFGRSVKGVEFERSGS